MSTIRKIFQFREICQTLIRHEVENGASTFLRLDNWHPLEPLYKRYGENVCSNIGRSLQAKVSTVIKDGNWVWARQRNRYIQEIITNTPQTFLPNISIEDSVVWFPSRIGNYSMKSAWEAIRVSNGILDWCSIVWFSKNVPRWAFILWMAMQSKLASKDRLLKWSVVDNATCVLCRNGTHESHNHLFFDCSHSRVVWKEILQRNFIHRGPLTWEDEKKWFLLHSKGKFIKKSILKLSLAATVYGIWCERNMRIFQHKMMEAEVLGSKICNNIREQGFVQGLGSSLSTFEVFRSSSKFFFLFS